MTSANDQIPLIASGILGDTPAIDPTADVAQCRFGRFVEIGARTTLHDVHMDDYSYVVNDSHIAFATIGKFCSIAAHTRINPGNHPMQRASQSHFSYRASRYFPGERDDTGFFAWRRANAVAIGHDAWLGHGAVVLPGRNIGIGAVVAAGAIVTRDVANYTIVAGNPARVVRRRFSQDIEGKLLAISWWDWSHEQLRLALPDFQTLPIEEFCDKYQPVSG